MFLWGRITGDIFRRSSAYVDRHLGASPVTDRHNHGQVELAVKILRKAEGARSLLQARSCSLLTRCD